VHNGVRIKPVALPEPRRKLRRTSRSKFFPEPVDNKERRCREAAAVLA